MILVKKLSPKTVAIAYGETKVTLPEGEEKALLFTVLGIASGYKTGDSNYGPYVAFTGRFQANGEGQKEPIQSGTLFLPEPAQTQLREALDEAAAAIPEGSRAKPSLQLAFNIGIVKDERSNTGYQYTVESLIEPEPEHDPLTALSNSLPETAVKMLPAPKRGRGKKSDD